MLTIDNSEEEDKCDNVMDKGTDGQGTRTERSGYEQQAALGEPFGRDGIDDASGVDDDEHDGEGPRGLPPRHVRILVHIGHVEHGRADDWEPGEEGEPGARGRHHPRPT